MIAGYYRPDEGGVIFDGRDVTALPPHAICRLGLTRTFQIVKPFGNLSVRDNVMIGALTRLPSVARRAREAEQRHRDLRARPRTPTRTPGPCPSACASGSRWRVRSPRDPACCCSTR